MTKKERAALRARVEAAHPAAFRSAPVGQSDVLRLLDALDDTDRALCDALEQVFEDDPPARAQQGAAT